MQVTDLEVPAGRRENRTRQTAVLVLYKHRLFRDIVGGVVASNPDIADVQATRSGEHGLRLIEDLNADRVVLVVETETHVSLARGPLAFLLRMTEGDPRIRVVAITLAGFGMSLKGWRWLNHVDSARLVQEILSD